MCESLEVCWGRSGNLKLEMGNTSVWCWHILMNTQRTTNGHSWCEGGLFILHQHTCRKNIYALDFSVSFSLLRVLGFHLAVLCCFCYTTTSGKYESNVLGLKWNSWFVSGRVDAMVTVYRDYLLKDRGDWRALWLPQSSQTEPNTIESSNQPKQMIKLLLH